MKPDTDAERAAARDGVRASESLAGAARGGSSAPAEATRADAARRAADAAPAAPRRADARLAALIALLEDESPVVWSEVRRELESADHRARPLLARAARSPLARTRSRVRAILAARAKRRAAGRLLRFATGAAETLRTTDGTAWLERGFWLLSRFHSPGVDLLPHRRALDAMAREVRRRSGTLDDPVERALALRDYLGRELRFGGSIGDYYHPDNVALHRAVERKAGMPLTLSALYAFVARRAGLAAAPMPLPGHVLVRLGTGEASLVVDPYHGGKVRGQREIRRLLAQHGLGLDSVWFRCGDELALFERQILNTVRVLHQRSLQREARLLETVLHVLDEDLPRRDGTRRL